MARNEAELSGTSAGWNSVPVKVNVLNVDEGPEFSAPTITFNIKENIPNDTLIGRYAALDPETKSSNGITSATFIVFCKSSSYSHESCNACVQRQGAECHC